MYSRRHDTKAQSHHHRCPTHRFEAPIQSGHLDNTTSVSIRAAKYRIRPSCRAAYHRHRTTTTTEYIQNTPEIYHKKTVSTTSENLDSRRCSREFKRHTRKPGTFSCEEVPAQQDRMR
ncbi:unnamed protein product [Ectocarpus sp. 13 AM-2016]